MKTRLLLVLLFPLLGALLVAGLRLMGRPGIEYGEAQSLGDGTVRSFVTYDRVGQPLTLGILMGGTALDNLPAHSPAQGPAYETVVNLPSRVKGLPFDHVTVDWNPMGHEPEGMYTQPHFDFHFYTMTETERNTIDPMVNDFEVKASQHPEPHFLPDNHVLAPGAVPRMGTHWVDATAPELNGQPFTTTFLYGSWNGIVTFLEPMITKAYLESIREMEGQTVRMPIPQPKAVHKSGYYPTAYAVQYDESNDTYAIVLEDLQQR